MVSDRERSRLQLRMTCLDERPADRPPEEGCVEGAGFQVGEHVVGGILITPVDHQMIPLRLRAAVRASAYGSPAGVPATIPIRLS